MPKRAADGEKKPKAPKKAKSGPKRALSGHSLLSLANCFVMSPLEGTLRYRSHNAYISAYMYFATEQRAAIKAENPDATFGELGTIMGQKWKVCILRCTMACEPTSFTHRFLRL